VIGGCILCGGADFVPRFDRQEFSVKACGQCGLVQLHPRPGDETIAELYDAEYYETADGKGYSNYTARESEYRATFADDLRRIESHFGGRGPLRILDVGCGPGAFLSVALGAGHDVFGMDIIPSVVDQARVRFPGRVFLGALDDVRGALPAPFDVVFASHVIEHVTAPVAFTRTCAELLRSGGALVYVTPNVRSWLALISGRRWVSFKFPEHVAYYDPATIARLFKRSGLELAEIGSAFEYHNVEFLAERARKLVRPIDRLVPPIERVEAIRRRVIKVTSGSLRAIARKPRD
jgi:2-polyprenyl-3-methyl-5-hydroxy-6-metoxy-1,4-benzoquinol methylase